MKILISVPTKDGGEGFLNLTNAIKKNIEFARSRGLIFTYEALLIINGNSEKPLRFIRQSPEVGKLFTVIKLDFLGKVKAMNYVLDRYTADFYVFYDDDVTFGEDMLYLAINSLQSNNNLKLVSFQTRALSYSGQGVFSRFCYDIINVRSLQRLYKGTDPFLFGRFIVARQGVFKIPNYIINEDLYLSIIYDGQYEILSQEILYQGEHSIAEHTRRVLRLVAGRRQLRKMFGEKYDEIHERYPRLIDRNRFKSIGVYYQLCYYLYKILRVYTNLIVANLRKHKTSHW